MILLIGHVTPDEEKKYVHGRLEHFAAFAHFTEGFQGNVIVPAVHFYGSGVVGGVADQFFELIRLCQQLSGNLGFTAARRADQHHDARLV